MQTICYKDNHYIVDIKNRDCPEGYQSVVIDETKEVVRVENGKLVKYDYKEENKKISEEKEKAKKLKEKALKQKLNLTDEEFNDLKEVLK